jgi:hypothetical protein
MSHWKNISGNRVRLYRRKFRLESPLLTAGLPSGSAVVAPAIFQAVKAAVVEPDMWLSSPDSSLRCTKRKLKDSNIYLFFNEGPTATSDSVTFHSDGQLVEQWHPVTGAVSSVVSTRNRGTMSVQLKLKPYETRVWMVRQAAEKLHLLRDGLSLSCVLRIRARRPKSQAAHRLLLPRRILFRFNRLRHRRLNLLFHATPILQVCGTRGRNGLPHPAIPQSPLQFFRTLVPDRGFDPRYFREGRHPSSIRKYPSSL